MKTYLSTASKTLPNPPLPSTRPTASITTKWKNIIQNFKYMKLQYHSMMMDDEWRYTVVENLKIMCDWSYRRSQIYYEHVFPLFSFLIVSPVLMEISALACSAWISGASVNFNYWSMEIRLEREKETKKIFSISNFFLNIHI